VRIIKDGWQSQEVFDTLDLCLSCKGCKHGCPVNVDMAAYKAEFLSHYYQNRLRPRHAYAMGWTNLWARAASLFPEIANFMTQSPGISAVAKLAGGIAPERRCRNSHVRHSNPGSVIGLVAIPPVRKCCSGPTRLTTTSIL
jgi:Fe-S oxidoreductase